MSNELTVPVHFKLEVGDNHNAEINTTVIKGTEVAYFTGALVGAIKGMADASAFLKDLLFPDDTALPNELKPFAAAESSAEKLIGG